jgi:uncharacterized protein YabN with tetrapyrrole methylase and pyrophosphatase domain
MRREATGEGLIAFLETMRTMRTGCAWKAAQGHESLAPYVLEEAQEVVEAIGEGAETGDWSHLREELGDLLLQVYFHAVVAEEAGEFTIDDVVRDLTEKMIRRNPHVFGPEAADGPYTIEQVEEIWQAAKARERGQHR